MRPTLERWSGVSRDGTPCVYRICFVCTGNICRSPMAEVVLRALSAPGTPAGDALGAALDVSSAGTGNWHQGEPMDPRARRALEAAGYRDHGHVATAFDVTTAPGLDLLVGLDRRHLETVRGRATARGFEVPMALLRPFDRNAGGALDVPDPYYGDDADFDTCLATVAAACAGLVEALTDAMAPGEGPGVPGPAVPPARPSP